MQIPVVLGRTSRSLQLYQLTVDWPCSTVVLFCALMYNHCIIRARSDVPPSLLSPVVVSQSRSLSELQICTIVADLGRVASDVVVHVIVYVFTYILSMQLLVIGT